MDKKKLIMPFKKRNRENVKSQRRSRFLTGKAHLRNNRRTELSIEETAETTDLPPDESNIILEPNESSTSRHSIPQIMDECHRNEMDSRDCNECRTDINCKQTNTRDSENIMNNVTEDRNQEVGVDCDSDNSMSNAIEETNEVMEVEPVVDGSTNNETAHTTQNVEVPVQLVDNIEEIVNGMEVSIETEEGNVVNLTHFDPLLDLLNKKTSPFANNEGELTPEKKKFKKMETTLADNTLIAMVTLLYRDKYGMCPTNEIGGRGGVLGSIMNDLKI